MTLDKNTLKVGENTTITARFDPIDFQPANPEWLVIAPPGGYAYGQFTVSAVQKEGDRLTGTVTAGERLGAAQVTLKATNVSQALSREAAQLIGSVNDQTQAGVSTLTVSPSEITAKNWHTVAFDVIGSPKNNTDSLIGTLDVSVANPSAVELLGIDYQDNQHARIYFQVFNSSDDSVTVTGQVAALNYQPAQFKIIIEPNPTEPIVPLTGNNDFTEPPAFLPPQTFNNPTTNSASSSHPLAQQVLSWLTPSQTHAQTTSYGCVTLIVAVQDQNTQAPIQNAQVKLWSPGQNYPIVATDALGQAVINDVVILVYQNTTNAAPYNLNITYYHPQSRREYTTTKTITIPPDKAGQVHRETAGLKIEEETDRPCNEDAPVTVSGTITDKDGNPLKEAMVVWDWENLVFTDGKGQYRVEDLLPGTVYGLLVFNSDATEVPLLDPELVDLPCGQDTATVDVKTQ